MFGLIKRWKALEAKGIMGINRRNADYVLKYNKRHLYPIVDDKILTKERAIAAGAESRSRVHSGPAAACVRRISSRPIPARW